jgi:hypothetical protein
LGRSTSKPRNNRRPCSFLTGLANDDHVAIVAEKHQGPRSNGIVFDLLAYTGNPATIHYLIELYEYLIPGDPAGVFDAIYEVLLGPAGCTATRMTEIWAHC